MYKHLPHILLLAIMLFSAIQATAQITMPDTVCVGTTRIYTVNDATVPSTYTWKINGVIQSATTNSFSITWTIPDTYTITVQEHSGVCDGQIQSGEVHVISSTPVFDPVLAICSGATLTALPTTSLNGIKGTWSPALNNTETTTYTFTPTVGECATTSLLTIPVKPNITLAFDASSLAFTNYGRYAVNDEIKFNILNTEETIIVLWDFGDGSTSSEMQPSHTYTELGIYRVTLTMVLVDGCSYPYTKDIEITKGYTIITPNGFTPNGDGVNDYFKPESIGVVSSTLLVYDTWGSLVYSETGAILKGWDGLIRNSEAENGNYIYKIIAQPFNASVPVEFKGPFTLIK
jgi:gliding motility-associated-like protein